MKNLTIYLFAVACMMHSMSCNKSASEAGNDISASKEGPYGIFTNPDETFFTTPLFPGQERRTDGYYSHSSVMVPSGHNSEFDYISENDIVSFYRNFVSYRKNVIYKMVADMKGDFYEPLYKDRYSSLISPKVKEQMKLFADNKENRLKGWQVFKPSPEFDRERHAYKVVYDDGDWFTITDNNQHTVRIQMVAAGPKLNPVITEVRNDMLSINTEGNPSVNQKIRGKFDEMAAVGYRHNSMNNDRMYQVSRFVYNCHKKMHPGSEIVTGRDFTEVTEAITTEGRKFVEDYFSTKDTNLQNNISVASLGNGWYSVSENSTDQVLAKVHARRRCSGNSYTITEIQDYNKNNGLRRKIKDCVNFLLRNREDKGR